MGTICISAFALAVVLAQQHPQTTNVPHARQGMENGVGRRVRQGSSGPAPLPLDSTPTQSGCCTGLAASTNHPSFVSISRLLRHSSLRQPYFEKMMTKASYSSILSFIILWLYLMYHCSTIIIRVCDAQCLKHCYSSF